MKYKITRKGFSDFRIILLSVFIPFIGLFHFPVLIGKHNPYSSVIHISHHHNSNNNNNNNNNNDDNNNNGNNNNDNLTRLKKIM